MDTLVSTKLRPSHISERLVARPRLIEHLKHGPEHRLTLLSAPAGFGKTTLLNEWTRSWGRRRHAFAWLSLDEGDNDPVRFLAYLVDALRSTGQEQFGESILAALRLPERPQVEALLGVLINELDGLRGEVTVILDDYHLIEAESVHSMVTFLLERLPERAHLVISGRADPPLPLARFRARGQMTELNAAGLRFTAEEAQAYLNGVMGLNLSADDVSTLEGVTEGWIAAIQLAALSMRERDDVSVFIRSFSGGHRDLFDFLAEEVLERQPEPVQTFLLETSILDRLNGPLCDAVTGYSGGREMLERLDRENLLVVPLDDQRRWYRYHHLFADFLRGRLERERPSRLAPLHLRACEWCEENGLIGEAVQHALAIGDHERAALLMERGIGQTWYRGEVVTLLGWLRTLPEDAMRHRPLLLVWYAAGLMLVGEFDSVESLLQYADRALDDLSDEGSGTDESATDLQRLIATVASVRSLHARRMGDARAAIAHAQRALAVLPEDNLDPRPFAAYCLADAYRAAGDIDAAIAAFANAGSLGRTAAHGYVALSAMASQAHLQLAEGRLRDAEDVLRRALSFAVEQSAELLPAVGSVRIGMGELQYEWNDLDASADNLAEGVELAKRTGDVEIVMWGYIAQSRILRARGDIEGALTVARTAQQIAQNSGVDHQIVDSAVWLARLHLTSGDPAAAAAELERAAGMGEVRTVSQELERIALARLVVARNETAEALRLLDQLGETAQSRGRTISILIVRALALRASGDRAGATRSLAEALALAETEGYVRTFVDEGPAIAELLTGVLEAQQAERADWLQHVPAHYLRKLLSALDQGQSATEPPVSELPEPLSERELEVLRLIAAGESNRRIAAELFISVGTVKTHIINTYRKLDAHSRTQAVARARDLNLL